MSALKETARQIAAHLLSIYNAGGGIESITIQELTDDVREKLRDQNQVLVEDVLVDICDQAAREFNGCEYDGEEILFLSYDQDSDLSEEEWCDYFCAR